MVNYARAASLGIIGTHGVKCGGRALLTRILKNGAFPLKTHSTMRDGGGGGLARSSTDEVLRSFEVVSFRMIVAKLAQGNFVLKVAVTHFHGEHSLRYQRSKRIIENLPGPVVLLLADHNSIVVKGRGVYRPGESEPPTALHARDMQSHVLSECNMVDVWPKVHEVCTFQGFGTRMICSNQEGTHLGIQSWVSHSQRLTH